MASSGLLFKCRKEGGNCRLIWGDKRERWSLAGPGLMSEIQWTEALRGPLRNRCVITLWNHTFWKKPARSLLRTPTEILVGFKTRAFGGYESSRFVVSIILLQLPFLSSPLPDQMLKLQFTIVEVLGIARFAVLCPALIKHTSVFYKFLLIDTSTAV